MQELEPKSWYVVLQADTTCQIVDANQQKIPSDVSHWGPFASQEEAIARRVGLIRAGKCQPYTN